MVLKLCVRRGVVRRPAHNALPFLRASPILEERGIQKLRVSAALSCGTRIHGSAVTLSDIELETDSLLETNTAD